MQRLVFLGLAMMGMCSCSSSTEDSSAEKAQEGPKVGKEYSLSSRNPFEWSDDDVKASKSGAYVGGKRSQFENKGAAGFAKKSSPSFLNKKYTKDAWKGNKSYSTGSYKTGSFREAGARSRFGQQKAGEGAKVARASGQSFKTGSYRTGSARETGRAARTNSSAYVDNRRKNYGWTPPVFGREDYRRMTMGQAKSLLNR